MTRLCCVLCAVMLGMLFGAMPAVACTNVLVTKGASADGSLMLTYTADSAGFFARLETFPAADYPEGATVVVPFRHFVPGKKALGDPVAIPQVRHTYHVIGASGQGLINEHQLAIAETTFVGREELVDPRGAMNYETLITLALQRATTAREAILVMTALSEQYGYHDVGESISAVDTQEAWVLEIVGCGKDSNEESGRVAWVAIRIPDGEIHCHANQARIRTFDTSDPSRCLASKNVESFAVKKGWYDPTKGEAFRFDLAYAPPNPTSKRTCEARVWSVYRRAAPSLELSDDYHRGAEGAEPYPWSIRPDTKLSLADVMALMRDHYAETPYDMTTGIDAGPHGLPRRWRPLTWSLPEAENKEADPAAKPKPSFMWERPISTPQTAFSFVSQSRSWLPNPVGGCLWYGVDDSYLSCYFPVYCTATRLPRCFTIDTANAFSWESAWWVFNLVANYANLNYAAISPEIISAQQEMERSFIDAQREVESRETSGAVLNDYSLSCGEQVFKRWQRLAVELFTTFNDGYIRRVKETSESGAVEYKYDGFSYPEAWLRRVATERPGQFVIPTEKPAP